MTKFVLTIGLIVVFAVVIGAAGMGIRDDVERNRQERLALQIRQAEIEAQASVERQQAFYAFLAHVQSVGFIQIVALLGLLFGVGGLIVVGIMIAKRPRPIDQLPVLMTAIATVFEFIRELRQSNSYNTIFANTNEGEFYEHKSK